MITFYIENTEGFVSSMKFDSVDDVILYPSMFAPGCKITLEIEQ